jgi:hypothetical protein
MFRPPNVAIFREGLHNKWPEHVADYAIYTTIYSLSSNTLDGLVFLIMGHQYMVMNHLKSSKKLLSNLVKSYEYLNRAQNVKILSLVSVMLNIFYPMLFKTIGSINKAKGNGF